MTWLTDAVATQTAGHAIGKRLKVGDVVGLSGPLGAGKTSLARGILSALGYAGDVPSPTFGMVIPYAPPDVRFPVAHVDLYRLDDMTEIEELGLDDALADGALIIEWAERLGNRLWPNALQIELSVEGDARRLTAKVPSSWEARWPFN